MTTESILKTLLWVIIAGAAGYLLWSYAAHAGNCFTSCQNGPGYSHCQTHCD